MTTRRLTYGAKLTLITMVVLFISTISLAVFMTVEPTTEQPVFSGYEHDAELLPRVHSGDYLKYFNLDTNQYDRVEIP